MRPSRLLAAATLAVASSALGGCLPQTGYACSIPETQRCQDTAAPGTWWLAFDGTPQLIDVRPAPSDWATSPDRHFQVAEWAALVETHGQQVLAACTYSDFREVTCKAPEQPPAPSYP